MKTKSDILLCSMVRSQIPGAPVLTVGPVEHQIGPGPVHELGAVVRVEGGVVEPAHGRDTHRQSTWGGENVN